MWRTTVVHAGVCASFESDIACIDEYKIQDKVDAAPKQS